MLPVIAFLIGALCSPGQYYMNTNYISSGNDSYGFDGSGEEEQDAYESESGDAGAFSLLNYNISSNYAKVYPIACSDSGEENKTDTDKKQYDLNDSGEGTLEQTSYMEKLETEAANGHLVQLAGSIASDLGMVVNVAINR
jgi:hypothetical protein